MPRRKIAFTPAHLELARKVARLGAIDAEIADCLGVSLRTYWNWRAEHPELARAVKLGKAEPDARVERSLYQRAVGYVAPEVVIHQMPDRVGKDGRLIKGRTVQTEVLRQYPPDSVACMFWLKNRKRGEWYDIKAVELGNLGGNSFRVSLLPEDAQVL
ncbi:MAG TPA: helix-turn-helix domain-containing protein [Burkholderiaceae bacterium]|nr:helix-turn-helix domain-containing protein [Burkholderiaceae bacterium]